MSDIKVENAMTKKIIKVNPDDSVKDVAKKMKEKDIGSMLVSMMESIFLYGI